MDKLFGSLQQFFKQPPVRIDNYVFRLHYRGTLIILLAFSLMVTSKQYFGDPIDCISKDDIPSKLLDTFCWIHTTFSLENAWRKEVGAEVPYPGVDKSTENEKRVYHAYYQWVCFVLFFQACFFYVPRFIWKAVEGGRTETLSKELKNQFNEKDKQIRVVANYLKSIQDHSNGLFYWHFGTEMLNFVNVIVQMILMDKFLGGEFTTYGWDVMNFTEWDWNVRYDPMIKVFPRLTKCTFHRYGSSGDVQKHDAMCILPINIINEKIYLVLWFWFYFMAVLSAIAVIYRLFTLFSVSSRVNATFMHCRAVNKNVLRDVVDRIAIGDWFVIDLLSRNMSSNHFCKLIDFYLENKPNHIEA